jgi:pyruvate/2-oxoglutarate dehydrogenase complex dihydrolipoamide acyltransferase (E2) component
MKPLRLLAAALATTLLCAAEEPAPGFIRVDEDDNAARLQTAVTRYEKDGVTVDLIGAVHIADKKYYETLSKRFEGYESLLYEMIGGEKFNAAREAAAAPNLPAEKPAEPEAPAADDAPAEEEEKKDMSGLHQIYGMVARFLALTGQTDHIDYTKKNFVHADLTHDEFEAMQKERGESLLGFAMKNAKQQQQAGAKQPDMAKLMTAMLAGNSNLVKLQLIHTLGQGDDQIGAFAGESVIITDRNIRAIEVTDREIAAGKKKLAIFYGAAHFPDMEKRLLEKGFKRTTHEWITAWDIPKPQPKPQPAPAPEKEAA